MRGHFRIARLTVLLATLLGGCGFLPPSQQQEFSIVGEVPPQATPATGFHTTDANINDTLAKSLCADGYEKLDAKSLPAQDDAHDQESYNHWRVRCTEYFPRLF